MQHKLNNLCGFKLKLTAWCSFYNHDKPDFAQCAEESGNTIEPHQPELS